MAPGPCSARIAASRAASASRASSQPARSKRASRRERSSGTIARSRAWTAAGSSRGLRQVRPRLTGWRASPATSASRPRSTRTFRPQPTPQNGHVVAVSPDTAGTLRQRRYTAATAVFRLDERHSTVRTTGSYARAEHSAPGRSYGPPVLASNGSTAPHTEYVVRTVEERGVRFVRLWFVDVLGLLKSFAIPVGE